MATANQILDLARSQIGVKESPANSNNTKYGQWYGMNYEPWCDMFISWLAAQVGQTDIGKYAFCPYHVNHFKNKGLWLGRITDPKPGDIVFFANQGTACHVGIVESRNSISQITTIEGNTSVSSNDNGGAVMRRTRTYGTVGSTWYILGFARPKYEVSNMGWIKDEKGWWYKYHDGSYPTNTWRDIDGYWYWFNQEGYAATGWQAIEGKWYYFNTSTDDGLECAMRTGWYEYKGKWTYLKEHGDAACFEVLNINGKYYAFDADCYMFTKVDSNGVLSN